MLCSAYYGPRLCAFCIHTQARHEDKSNKGGVEGYLDIAGRLAAVLHEHYSYTTGTRMSECVLDDKIVLRQDAPSCRRSEKLHVFSVCTRDSVQAILLINASALTEANPRRPLQCSVSAYKHTSFTWFLRFVVSHL